MNAARAIGIITRREISSRILTRSFVVGTIVTFVFIVGIIGLGQLFANDDPIEVGLVDAPPAVQERLGVLASGDDPAIALTDAGDREVGLALLDAGDIAALIVGGTEIVFTETDADVLAVLAPALSEVRLVDELTVAGLSSQEVQGALIGASDLTVTETDPDPESGAREAVAFAAVILLFIAVQISGAYVMIGVFEEKSSKVVEIVLSSVRARYLLAGKILGVGLLGLIQVATLAGAALLGASLFGSSVLPALSPALIASGILWFLLGYLLYGSVFAAGSSLAPRQEDAQSTLAPVSVLLMLSYFGSIFAATDPTSLGARVVSWIPFSAPFAMPGRIATGDVGWIEVGAVAALTAATAALMILLAERIYVRSVIHTDRTLGWREAWRMTS